MKKFLILPITLIILVLFVSCGQTSAYDEDELRDMSAMEFVETMGIGINLGNTLDSYGSWISSSGGTEAYETAWGNPVTTKEMIEYMHSQGFDTIRIPVTWDQHIDDDNGFLVDEDWMDRVEEVVDWALKEDMFVILNIHHDEIWIADAATDYDYVAARYQALWKQICDRFGDKSYRLIFESNNEVSFSGMSNKEGSALLYELNDLFIETVRSSGGKNADRMLLLAGYSTSPKTTAAYFPDIDDTRYAVSVHCYTPTVFTIATPGTSWGFTSTWGTEADYAELIADFEPMYERFIENGIPVIVGEYGCTTDGKDEESRELWIETVVSMLLDYDMCPILWDAGGSIDRLNLDWTLSGDRDAIWRGAGITDLE